MQAPASCLQAVLSAGWHMQVILGSIPGSDGSFDKVNDFTASINNGAWSVPLSTLLNETGDVAYVVPAARSTPCLQPVSCLHLSAAVTAAPA